MLFRAYLRLAILTILLLNAFVDCTSVEGATKRLVFALVDLDYVSPDNVASCAAAPSIDGLSLMIRWRNMEPQKGQFNFDKLDYAIKEAARRKKFVSICLMGSPKTPDWLANEKIQFFTTFGLSRSLRVDPVPWDVNYLALYKRFLAATAAHLKKMNMLPYVFAVTVAAPSQQITLVDCRHNKLGAVNYDRKKYMDACTQIIDSYHANFPSARELLIAPQRCMICAPDEDKAFFQDLMDYGLRKYGRSCWVLARDLKASGSVDGAATQAFASRSALGFQLAAASSQTSDKGLGGSFPLNFQQAIQYGIANGGIYFEVYSSDAVSDNPAIQGAIASIHQ